MRLRLLRLPTPRAPSQRSPGMEDPPYQDIPTSAPLQNSSPAMEDGVASSSSSPTTPFQLKIIYSNVHGIDRHKLKRLWALTNQDTLLFLTETWHVPDGFSIHSEALHATTPEARRRGVVLQGRRHGGLACWAGERVRGMITNTQVGPYGIAVTVAGKMIHAVYLPPVLDKGQTHAHSFKAYLRPADRTVPDILIGDINVSFGSPYGDKPPRPPNRIRVIQDLIREHGMTHHRTAADSPTTIVLDHLLTRPGIQATFRAHDCKALNIKTDHPVLEVDASWSQYSPPALNASTSMAGAKPPAPLDSTIQPTERIQLKHLDTPRRLRTLLWHWNTAYPKLRRAIQKAEQELEHGIRPQRIIDRIDRLLVRAIWDVAKRAFGSYSVAEVKQKPDYLTQGLVSKPSPEAAMRQYRRAQRGRQATLVSRNPNVRVAEDVMNFYQEVYNFAPINDSWIAPAPQWNPREDPLLPMFDVDSVDRAIRSYPVSKSMGPDGIHHRLIRALASAGLNHLLASLFRLTILTGTTPTRWNTSILHPIPKGKSTAGAAEFIDAEKNATEDNIAEDVEEEEDAMEGVEADADAPWKRVPKPQAKDVRQNDFRTIDKMRPISLTVMFRRLYEKCLLSSLTAGDNEFHPCQAGFRAGFSTVSQALVAHSDAASAPLGNLPQLFVDLRQAYDRVPIGRLFNKLKSRGMDATKLALLVGLCADTRSYINVNGVLSPRPFQRLRGLFQGSLLAPFLFNVFIDDLIPSVLATTSSISTPGMSSQVLLFADDIKLQAPTREELARMLTALHTWCDWNGMEINVGKSAELLPAAADGNSGGGTEPPLRIDGAELPQTEEYKYLGFPHRIDGVGFLDRARDNFKRATAMIHYLDSIGKAWTPGTRLAMYKTLVRPLLDFGGGLIWHLVWAREPPKNRELASWKKVGWSKLHLTFTPDPADNQALRKKAWDVLMTAHHKTALHWIACRSQENAPKGALASMMGLNNPKERMYKFAVLLHRHMNGLDPTSVAVTRMAQLEHTPGENTSWNSGLIARARNDAVLDDLPDDIATRKELTLPDTAEIDVHHRLRAFLMLKLQDDRNGVLVKFILPIARLPMPMNRPTMTEPRPDSLLFVKDTEVCHRAIEWRINRFAANCNCPCCGEAFRRSCVDRASCSEVLKIPKMVPVAKQKSVDRLNFFDIIGNLKYRRPDSLLNHKQYKRFRKMMIPLDTLLRKLGNGDEFRGAQPRDKTNFKAAKAARRKRHEPDKVDASTAPVWTDPIPDAGPNQSVSQTNKQGPLGTLTTIPEGCLSLTMKLAGVWLYKTPLERYACLPLALFSYKLSAEDKLQFTSRGFTVPSVIQRNVIVDELNRRARGQGHRYHDHEHGRPYDPSQPWDEELADAWMRPLDSSAFLPDWDSSENVTSLTAFDDSSIPPIPPQNKGKRKATEIESLPGDDGGRPLQKSRSFYEEPYQPWLDPNWDCDNDPCFARSDSPEPEPEPRLGVAGPSRNRPPSSSTPVPSTGRATIEESPPKEPVYKHPWDDPDWDVEAWVAAEDAKEAAEAAKLGPKKIVYEHPWLDPDWDMEAWAAAERAKDGAAQTTTPGMAGLLPPGASTPPPAAAPSRKRKAPEPPQPPRRGTYFLPGVPELPNAVEDYAAVDSTWFCYPLPFAKGAYFTRWGLQIPSVKQREAILKELTKRARGQGWSRHLPSEGRGYDPLQPWVEKTREEIREIIEREVARVQAARAAGLPR